MSAESKAKKCEQTVQTRKVMASHPLTPYPQQTFLKVLNLCSGLTYVHKNIC